MFSATDGGKKKKVIVVFCILTLNVQLYNHAGLRLTQSEVVSRDLKVNVALMISTLCAELGRPLDYLAFGSLLLIFL